MTPSSHGPGTTNLSTTDRRCLFWACLMAIAAAAADFAVRGQVIGDWARERGLTETRIGEILGVGLEPFAAAIALVGVIADRIDYGRCLAFALIFDVTSAVLPS